MNVLAKIVIPKTKMTSKYILNELEEMAREEFFRLKKVLEIERRMFGGEKEQKQEPVMCTTCEAGPEWGVIERCVMCDALLLPEEEKEDKEEDEKIEEFKAHLSEIVNITKDMDEQGFIAASVEEFIKTAEQLKDKLEQKSEEAQPEEEESEPYDEHLNHLCGDCKKIYLEEKAAKNKEEEPEPEIVEPELVAPPLPLPPPPPPPPIKPVVYESPDLELGTFETEIKEITKVIRVKKEDGSIAEEKKVIKVKKEVRTPIKPQAVPQPNPINQDRAGRITYQPSGQSGGSSKSNPYSGSRTVGVVTTKSLDRFQFNPKYDIHQRRVKSEMFNSPTPMSNPVIRYCMSSVTLLSVDFGEYSPSLIYNYIDNEDYKSTSARLNVLRKIVIPRTSATTTYIISELEELAREEFSRLKKVKAKKKGKKNEKKHDHVEGHFCPICNKRTDKINADIQEDGYSGYILKVKGTEPPRETIKSTLPPPPLSEVTSSIRALSPSASNLRSFGDIGSRLTFVKNRLTDIITITKGFIASGIDSFDVKEFLIICEGAKHKIEEFFETEQTPCQLDADLKNQLECLKCNLKDVVDVTKDLKKEELVSSSIDKFIKACEIIDSKLNKQKPEKEKSKSLTNEFTAHIDDIMQMTQDYTSEGLLTPGVEDFLRSCSIIKAKIEGKPVSSFITKDIDEEKLDHLKDHISELEELTVGIQDNKVTSESIEKFISSCKAFKTKIEQDREKLQAKKAVNELSGHIDGTVDVGREAQKEGLLGDSIEDFINSIGDVKKRFNPEEQNKIKENVQETTVLDELKSKINDIIKSVTKIKSANLATPSMDHLLTSCETAKAKLDIYQKFPKSEFEKIMIYPDCSESCICERESLSTGECERCQQMGSTVPYFASGPAPCGSCQDTIKEKAPSEQTVCGTCSSPYEEYILPPEPTPILSPEESEICEVCEMLKKEKEAETEPQEVIPPAVDSSLGYFEKKVRKITKVKRTQNPDGTIREEKETITVKQEKHDPNETSLLDDDENEEYDVSYDSLEGDDGKRVAVCSTPNQNQRGFLYLNNKAKSETVFRASPMTVPILKHCISYDCYNVQNIESIAKDSISIELDFFSLNCDSATMDNN